MEEEEAGPSILIVPAQHDSPRKSSRRDKEEPRAASRRHQASSRGRQTSSRGPIASCRGPHAKPPRPHREAGGQAEDRKETMRSTVVDVDGVREKMKGGEEEEKEDEESLLEAERQEGKKPRGLGPCEWLLMVLVLALVLLFLPLSIWFCIKVVREHERAATFRLGHLLTSGARGPGLLFHLPWVDVCQKIDVRLKMLKVPSQTVVTRDLVRTQLSSICLYRVENVTQCSTSLSNPTEVVQTLVQEAVRTVVAQHDFTHVLLNRRSVAQKIQVCADAVSGQWGIRVERADIQELSIPVELQQSLLAQTEAKAQAQIKVIAAEGEKLVSQSLRESLDLLSAPPAALQLRLLQLLAGSPLLLSLTSDFSALPPPPPPPKAGEGDTDSPMM